MNKLSVVIVFLLIFSFSLSVNATEVSEKKDINIGLLPFVSATRLIKLFLPFKQYLETELNYNVRLLTAPNFREFLKRTHAQQYDVVFTAPHAALLAEQIFGYQRLAKFSRQLKACVFVRHENKLTTLAELKNSMISTPGPLAIVSVLGEVMLGGKKIGQTTGIHFLRATSHNNVIFSVLNKEAEAGVVSLPVFKFYTSKESNKHKIQLVACSESIPSPMFMANQSINESEMTKLIFMFLQFPDSEYGKKFFQETPYIGVEPISNEDMGLLNKYMETLKIRLGKDI